jgi:hypothetical protein
LTAPPELDSPAKVASLIGRLRQLYAVSHATLILIEQSDIFETLDRWGLDQYYHVGTLRHDGTSHRTPLYESLQDVQARRESFSEDYERATLSGMLITVGDACSRNEYFDKTPSLELLRHLRNSAGHGNTFSLREGEPRRDAHFRESFRITASLNGRRNVLFNFIGAGDILDLLAEVESHLRYIEGRWGQ